MELKFYLPILVPPLSLGFNRTFMELKFPNKVNNILITRVLIVPLWN